MSSHPGSTVGPIGRAVRAALVTTVLATVLVVGPPPVAAAGPVFVDADATGANNGSSWANAFTDLHDALAAVGNTGDPIYVAAGVYTPAATDRTVAFALPGNARIFGGYAGGTPGLGVRNPAANPTVLSGDLAGDDATGGSNAENSFTVVKAINVDNVVLDGFVIEGGNANGVIGGLLTPEERIQVDGPAFFGFGVTNSVFQNLVVRGNAGGSGVLGSISFEASSNVDLLATRVVENQTNAIGSYGAALEVINTVVADNSGAGLVASTRVVSSNQTTRLINSTLGPSGQISITNNAFVEVDNSILRPGLGTVVDNPARLTVRHSNVEGSGGSGAWNPTRGIDGGNNIDADPLFIAPDRGNYRIDRLSPSAGTGNLAAVPTDASDVDADGDLAERAPDVERRNRVIGTVDMGAHERVCSARAYVDVDAAGANNGTSWANAYTSLADANQQARGCEGGDIWVAAGTYRPTTTTDRTLSFLLPPHVRLYGGFAGGETTLAQRDPAANITVLSGDIGVIGSTVDNSYHVVRSDGANSETRLDGFQISGGFANGPGADGRGGGLLVEDGGSPTLVNLVVQANASSAGAGGISFLGAGGAPRLVSSFVRQNSTQGDGGNLRIGSGVDARVVNTVISQGSAQTGGGVSDLGSITRFIGTTIADNDAIATNDQLATVAASDIDVQNSIVWGVPVGFVAAGSVRFEHSLVENSGGSAAWVASFGVDGGGNLDGDPDFAGPFDYRLLATSPAIDAGDQTLTPVDAIDVDDDGDLAERIPDVARLARVVDAEVDLGAFESAACASTPVLVDDDATGSQTGLTWSNAISDLQDALVIAEECAGTEIWVAEGTYLATSSGDRSVSFVIPADTAVFGGFDGTETIRSERNPNRNPSVLSGDLLGNDNDVVSHVDPTRADNTRVLVRSSQTGARLDGLVLSGASNDAVTPQGAALEMGGGSLVLVNSVLRANALSTTAGAIVDINGGSLTMVSTKVIDSPFNPALAAAFATTGSIVNSEFSDVGSVGFGGSSNFELVNVTMVDTTLTRATSAVVTVENSVLVDTAVSGAGTQLTFTRSNVDGSGGSGAWNATFGVNGGGNIDADPLFADRGRGRFHLLTGSPSIDAGLFSLVPADVHDVDDDGDLAEAAPDGSQRARIVGAAVDQGAYEGACLPVHRVDHDAAGDGSGSSWVNATNDLGDVLTIAALCSSEVWVAFGTYAPTPASDRSASFDVAPGVRLLGGFLGNESTSATRNPSTNPTVLSGDLAGDDAAALGGNTENAYTVVSIVDGDADTAIDGFRVTGGNANGPDPETNRGAGISVVGGAPVLANLDIRGNEATNRAGGLQLRATTGATVANVIIRDNHAGTVGGGVWLGDGAIAELSNLLAYDNSATTDGGAMLLGSGAATVVNATIVDNSAGSAGAGIRSVAGTHRVANSIVFANTSPAGANVSIGGGSVTFVESDVRNSGGSAAWNAAFGTDGGGNVDISPLFADRPGDNYRLAANSPLIDAGVDAELGTDTADLDRDGSVGEATPLDLDGRNRVIAARVDMGPYEGPACPASSPVFVDRNAVGVENGATWATAYRQLTSALAIAAICPGTEIWVTDDRYLPTTSTTDRSASFVIPDGTRLFGGFAGNESTRNDRDALAQTVLSGAIDGVDSPPGNSYHVVTMSGVSSATVVDAVLITNGNANGAGRDSTGGGVLVEGGSPRLSNMAITANRAVNGAGIMIVDSSARVLRSVIRDNVATGLGGGVRIEGGAPQLVNLEIRDNTASENGGVSADDSDVTMTNLTVAANEATSAAPGYAGIEITGTSSAVLSNIISWHNIGSGSVGRVNLRVASPTTVTSFSNIGGSGGSASWNTVNMGTNGGNNIDADPQFTALASGDVTLLGNSPSIDTGTDLSLPLDADDLDMDGSTTELSPPLRGTRRLARTAVDQGAHEADSCRLRYYVDETATGLDDGGSWTNAFVELTDAIIAADGCAGSEIWVARGQYLPSQTNDRDASFSLVEGVGIYGGFAGTETARSQRDPSLNVTVLSGDLNGNDALAFQPMPTSVFIRSDNSHRVVDASGFGPTSVLDGFTISDGNLVDLLAVGAGILVDGGSPTLTNLIVEHNSARWGGGIGIEGGADPDLTGTIVRVNQGDNGGGGVHIHDASPTLSSMEISGNRVAGTGGGAGIRIDQASPVLRDVEVTGNEISSLVASGLSRGGGIHIAGDGIPGETLSNVTIIDSTISLNVAASGGGISSQGSNLLGVPTVRLISTRVLSNTASAGSGGAIFSEDTNLSATSTLIALNTSTTGAAGIQLGVGVVLTANSKSVELSNVTIADNSNGQPTGVSSISGGGAGYVGTLENSIVWGNTPVFSPTPGFVVLPFLTVRHSTVEGSGGSGPGWTFGIDGGSNIAADPQFAGVLGGFYDLTIGSPAVDAGDESLVPSDAYDADADTDLGEPTPDLELGARVFGVEVDMGARELYDPASLGDGLAFVPIESCVVGDTSGFGPLAGGSVTTFDVAGSVNPAQGAEALDCGVPDGADAVLVELVATTPILPGNLLASASGVVPSGGVVNFSTTAPVLENSNAVVVPLSAAGLLDIGVNCGVGCVAPTTNVRLVVLGYYREPAGDPSELAYVPITPCTAFDSRLSQGSSGIYEGAYDAGEKRTFQVSGVFPAEQGGGATGCGVAVGATAVMVNLVAVNSAVSGKVAAGAAGTDPDEPVLAHSPLTPVMNNSNAVIVPLDSQGRLVIEAQGAAGAVDMVNVRAVVVGYLQPITEGGDLYHPLDACAAFDSRASQGATGTFAGPLFGNETNTYTIAGTFAAAQGGGNTDCGVPLGASAVLVNLVAVNPVNEGNLRVSATGTVATGGVVNFAPLNPVMNNSNAVIVPLSSDGRLDVTANTGALVGQPGADVRGVILGYLD